MTCAHSEICKTSLARQAVVTGNDGLSINIAPTIPHFIAWVCLKSHCPSALSLSSIHWNLGKLLFAKMSRSCSHDSSAVTDHVSSPLWGNRSGDWSSLKSRGKGPRGAIWERSFQTSSALDVYLGAMDVHAAAQPCCLPKPDTVLFSPPRG